MNSLRSSAGPPSRAETLIEPEARPRSSFSLTEKLVFLPAGFPLEMARFLSIRKKSSIAVSQAQNELALNNPCTGKRTFARTKGCIARPRAQLRRSRDKFSRGNLLQRSSRPTTFSSLSPRCNMTDISPSSRTLHWCFHNQVFRNVGACSQVKLHRDFEKKKATIGTAAGLTAEKIGFVKTLL